MLAPPKLGVISRLTSPATFSMLFFRKLSPGGELAARNAAGAVNSNTIRVRRVLRPGICEAQKLS
jgi:hypothetical protein